jgi:hypothetical protein
MVEQLGRLYAPLGLIVVGAEEPYRDPGAALASRSTTNRAQPLITPKPESNLLERSILTIISKP